MLKLIQAQAFAGARSLLLPSAAALLATLAVVVPSNSVARDNAGWGHAPWGLGTLSDKAAEAPRYTSRQLRMASDLQGCPTLSPAFLGANGVWALDVVHDGWAGLARGAVALCSDYFASVYSPVTRTPLLVIERLNAKQLANAKDEARSRDFFEDARVRVTGSPRLEDYRSSGFDRGHLSPAANQPDQAAMLQSFSLTNVAPQEAYFNQRVWSKVESDVRKYARRVPGDVFVITGVLFAHPEDPLQPALRPVVLGAGVRVPSHFFKVVIDPARGADADKGVWGWVMPNGGARMGPPVRGNALIAAGVPAAIVRGAMSEGKFVARRAPG